jgi:HlyD family secretion protein
MTLLCSIPLLATFFGACAAPVPLATGYVEGEFTLVAPVAIAQIERVVVARGDKVPAGAILVQLEQRDAEIAVAEAEAALAQAQGHLADLSEGERPEEIAVIEANLASAVAQAAESDRTRDRTIDMERRGVATVTQVDDSVTAAEVSAARVAVLQAQLAVAQLPARPYAIDQASASVKGAEAALDRAEWNLEQRTLVLSEPVTVVDVIRTEGEIAGPSAPVLSVLGDGAVKLSLYIPESAFATVAVGDELVVHCDTCPADLAALITYISDEPEFTPPVIYSLQNRQKLVYRVEARPMESSVLKPGQIVDVELSVADQ